MDLNRIHAQMRLRFATVVSLVAVSALALGACGGDNGGKAQTSAIEKNVPTKKADAAQKAKRKHAAKKKQNHKKKKKKKKKPKNAAEAFAQLGPSQRAKVLRVLVPRVLQQFGYKNSTVAVAAGGANVRVKLSPDEVCGGPENSDPIEQRIRAGAPIVQSLSIKVGDGGESLGSYVAAHCGPHGPPSAPGRVVLRVKGTGARNTKPFRVHRKRWTIAYSNEGGGLGVFAFYGSIIKPTGIQPNPVAITKRGRGKKVVKGKGTFTLKIVGPGPYEVVVHDGA